MITCKDGGFYLSTHQTAYWFRITPYGHLEHIYYGPLLPQGDMEPLALKHSAQIGSTIAYNPNDVTYSLDQIPLEFSTLGTGDYRNSPLDLEMPDHTYSSDFVYQSHTIKKGRDDRRELPRPQGNEQDCETLTIVMKDTKSAVTMTLYYHVYRSSDVITRHQKLTNQSSQPLIIHKIMSFCLDLPNRNYQIGTLSGGWIRESHMNFNPLAIGTYMQSSLTGSSSNQANPGFILSEPTTTQNHGSAFLFNLIYSGNHYSAIQRTPFDLCRLMMGINPQSFQWTLHPADSFETPEVMMAYSDHGYNGVSQASHHFINNHIIPLAFQMKARPIVYNNWEATFFKFNEAKLLNLAKQAKQLGAEVFVLDDGWFANRNDDRHGLGDYHVNPKKFPAGLAHFALALNKIGLDFGLWIEPESVNPDSQLYRDHPEYALHVPGRVPTLGRNQLILDLCNPDVRDYIVTQITDLLESVPIKFIKWDMNRHISDAYSQTLSAPGEFYHRYTLGLYDILERIFAKHPDVLLESCSSGGNRFDLGMLCYSPQIWASDNTDPIERLKIQDGLSYFYPPSTISAHVANAPHQQTLRMTPLPTRFNVAAFGILGYELDLNLLDGQARKEIQAQIKFYKAHRILLQFGRFARQDTDRDSQFQWQVSGLDQAIAGFFQTHRDAAAGYDRLTITDLQADQTYTIDSRPQPLRIEQFGDLIKHVLPIHLNPDGVILTTINKHFSLVDCQEHYTASGALCAQGILLQNQFMGTNYNPMTRLLTDYGSTLYTVKKKTEKSHE